MFSLPKRIISHGISRFRGDAHPLLESQILATGSLLGRANSQCQYPASLHELEFRVFSQHGDDGIIQWLTTSLNIKNKFFIEFGVEDYTESNTRYLLMSANWSGLILDGSEKHIQKIRSRAIYWRHELHATAAFIDRDNVDRLVSAQPCGREIGLLHIDIDGNDYWVWEAIESISPVIAIIEYNAVFGADRAITVPYRSDFQRGKAHHSHLYYGASLLALSDLGTKKGFTFIGCNLAGNNAYFVRNDSLTPATEALAERASFTDSKFRESRDVEGNLTYASGAHRIELIRGLSVWDTQHQKLSTI